MDKSPIFFERNARLYSTLVPLLVLLYLLSLVISDPFFTRSMGFTPAYGLALAFALHFQKRAIGPLVLAVGVFYGLMLITPSGPKVSPSLLTVYAVLNIAGPIITAHILWRCKRLCGPPFFDSVGKFTCFVFIGGIVSPVFMALGVYLVLYLTGLSSVSLYIESAYFWTLGTLVSVTVVTPLTVKLINRETSNSEIIKVGAFLVFTAIFMQVILHYVIKAEKYSRNLELENIAKGIAQELSNELVHIENAIEAMAFYLSGSDIVTAETFEFYAHPFVQRTGGIGLSWNALVNDQNRGQVIEQLLPVVDNPNQLIRISNHNDDSTVPKLGDVQLVVMHITPMEHNKGALGFDVYSNPERRIAINQAIVQSKPVASQSIVLVQNNHVGILVFNPVSTAKAQFESGDLSSLKGMVVGVIDFSALLQKLSLSFPGTAFKILDISNSQQVSVLGEIESSLTIDKSLIGIETLQWAGRHWQISASDFESPWFHSANIIHYGSPLLASFIFFWGMTLYLLNQSQLKKTDTKLKAKTQVLSQLAAIQHAFITRDDFNLSFSALAQAFYNNYQAKGVALFTLALDNSTLTLQFQWCDAPTAAKQFEELTSQYCRAGMLNKVADERHAQYLTFDVVDKAKQSSDVLTVFPTYHSEQFIGAVALWLPVMKAEIFRTEEHEQLLLTATGILYATRERERSKLSMLVMQQSVEEKAQAQRRTKNQGDSLAAMVQHYHLIAGNWVSAIQLICKEISRVLDTDRVSVWGVNESNKQLVCESLYDRREDSYAYNFTIPLSKVPNYFKALKEHSRISAVDAANDPATSELNEEYLSVYGVKSMLDACIVKDGEIVGVVCVEEVNGHREWQTDEENFITVMAGLVAQLYFKDELSRAKAVLEYQKMERALVVDNIPDAIATIDQCGSIKSTNPAFRHLFNGDEPVIHDADICEFLPALKESEIQSFAVMNTFSEVAGKRIDGSTFPVNLTVVRLPITPGDMPGSEEFLIFARDLSVEKQQKQKLIQSQKLEALGQLTGTVAHDFNNILGIIVGYGQLVASDVDDNLKGYVNEIVGAGERAKKLIKQLLVFSTKDNKTFVFQNLNTLVAKNLPSLKRAAKGQQLIFTPCQDEAVAVVEEEQFEHVLLNLVINAAHAMDKAGAISIDISLRDIGSEEMTTMSLNSGVYAVVSVKDTGHGIPEEMLSKIFEPFVTTKGKEGTGLGLAQVMAYMQMLEGNVRCTSQPGEGTLFELYFPTKRSVEEAPKPTAQQAKVDKHILVVDDEELLAKLFYTQLQKLGYKVNYVTSVSQALQYVQNESVDLVLSDIKMPEGGGLKLVKMLLQSGYKGQIQLMSGYSDEWSDNQVKQALIKDRLVKPFTVDELEEALNRCFTTQSSVSNTTPDA